MPYAIVDKNSHLMNV